MNTCRSVPDSAKVAYVLKRYPRYSETFVVSEILAHEAAGLDLQIFALYPPLDGHFQDIIAQVRSRVTYLFAYDLTGIALWTQFNDASSILPNFWQKLEVAQAEEVNHVYRAVQLACIVRQQGFTHLHAHFATSATIVARLASYFAEIHYSFTTHAKDIFHNSVIPTKYQQLLNDADAVVTVSDYNLNYLQQTYGSAASRVQRIYNGLDLQRFPFAAPYPRNPKILAVGRLIEKKGFAVLIEACKILVDRRISFTCDIIGTGEEEANLQRQILQSGVQDQVKLLGPRPQGELVQHVQSAAMLVAPCVVGRDSNQDGLPTVLLEAMALGTPCISTDVAGIPEVVRHEKTGLSVPHHDAIALADAIAHLLQNPKFGVQLATQARQLIEQEFDIHRNATQLRTLFRAAISVNPIVT